jgi:hypothetical protein
MSMDNDEPLTQFKTQWLAVQSPVEFALTTTGALTIEFVVMVPPGIPANRIGIEVPPEEVKILQRNLEKSQTIQETLTAKPPAQGAH